MKSSIFKSSNLLLILGAMALITACGGGGDGAPASNVTQGQFIDAAVEGLTYETASQSGETDANGTFSYVPGEEVTFYVGDIVIGTVRGTPTITPVQLVSGAINQDHPVVTNIVQFLLTIDDDGISSNGIQITPDIHDAAVGMSVDFTSATFDSDADVISAVSALTTAGQASTRPLVIEAVATIHLGNSLRSLLAGNYSGTFSGSANGNWNMTISADGIISGSGTANQGGTIAITGAVLTTGVFVASTSGWTGTIDITTGEVSGTWAFPGESGTYSGRKI